MWIRSFDEVKSITYANAIRSCTTSSAHAMRAGENHGLSTLIGHHDISLTRMNRPICNQLHCVVAQLHQCSDSWNVCPLSCLLALMFNLTSQLPETRSTRHASTKVGLHRHVCA